MSEADRLRRWLSRSVEAAQPEEPSTLSEAAALMEQLDALHDERRDRHDPQWFPPGPDPQGLERLVEDRRARGVLRARPQRRRSR